MRRKAKTFYASRGVLSEYGDSKSEAAGCGPAVVGDQLNNGGNHVQTRRSRRRAMNREQVEDLLHKTALKTGVSLVNLNRGWHWCPTKNWPRSPRGISIPYRTIEAAWMAACIALKDP